MTSLMWLIASKCRSFHIRDSISVELAEMWHNLCRLITWQADMSCGGFSKPLSPNVARTATEHKRYLIPNAQAVLSSTKNLRHV